MIKTNYETEKAKPKYLALQSIHDQNYRTKDLIGKWLVINQTMP